MCSNFLKSGTRKKHIRDGLFLQLLQCVQIIEDRKRTLMDACLQPDLEQFPTHTATSSALVPPWLQSKQQMTSSPARFRLVLRYQYVCILRGRVVIDYFAIELYIREINIALDALSRCENDPVDGVTRTNEESILEAAQQRVCRGENCISIFEDKRRALIFCGCPALCLAPARITSRERMEQRGSFFFFFFFFCAQH